MKQYHGDSYPPTRLYKIWRGMKMRCFNKKHPAYKNYGARGIKICDEWRFNYIKFKSWALQNNYSDDLEIDRKNNDLGYYPENCRFVTTQQNNRNRRGANKSSKYKGVTLLKRTNKWKVTIGLNKKNIHLGYFVSEIEAAKAYNEKAKELFGEFAYLNKIEE